jgi:hypothetical protein
LKITGAFLAEKVEARPNGMYVEGGVFPSLQQDLESGDQLVWLVVLVQRDGQDQRTEAEDFSFTAEVESLVVKEGTTSGKSFALEVGPESFLAGSGFSADLLPLSREDLPVDGLYTIIVTGPHGEKFTLPFAVGTSPSDIV